MIGQDVDGDIQVLDRARSFELVEAARGGAVRDGELRAERQHRGEQHARQHLGAQPRMTEPLQRGDRAVAFRSI